MTVGIYNNGKYQKMTKTKTAPEGKSRKWEARLKERDKR
jgi:hypothetical protein